MNIIYIIAQVLAFVACFFHVISMQCKKRKQILFFFIIGNIVGVSGLLLLKVYAGSLIQFVFALETIINYILEIKKKKNTISLVVFYIVLSTITSIITFHSLIDIIPLISAILHTITIIQTEEHKL